MMQWYRQETRFYMWLAVGWQCHATEIDMIAMIGTGHQLS